MSRFKLRRSKKFAQIHIKDRQKQQSCFTALRNSADGTREAITSRQASHFYFPVSAFPELSWSKLRVQQKEKSNLDSAGLHALRRITASLGRGALSSCRLPLTSLACSPARLSGRQLSQCCVSMDPSTQKVYYVTHRRLGLGSVQRRFYCFFAPDRFPRPAGWCRRLCTQGRGAGSLLRS